mmetsp:Transcript_24286/g.76424  ORF Transcript_24286/g.76424 Transcript_24286/m.76424 type:complete len:354 (+) Transcript_24286:104-1165(+)
MAKIGEGDDRWIVAERQDGTNVNNWHWKEIDAMQWSKKHLEEMFGGMAVLDGEGSMWLKTTGVQSLTGEAYLNQRKGKIIPGYELDIKLTWSGEVKDGEGKVIASADGTIHVPYLADENADEDPELKVLPSSKGPAADRFKDAMLAKGKQLVLEGFRKFVKDLAAGGPANDLAKAKEAGAGAGGAGAAAAPAAPAAAAAAKPKEEKKKLAPLSQKHHTITITERFHCAPKDIYDVLLDKGRVQAFTQSEAQASKEVGGKFSMFGGSVVGENLELEEPTKIVQKWKFTTWKEEDWSTVTITMKEPEPGNTILTLVQTNVPESDAFFNETVMEQTERGWKDLIFGRIKRVFGFGA